MIIEKKIEKKIKKKNEYEKKNHIVYYIYENTP